MKFTHLKEQYKWHRFNLSLLGVKIKSRKVSNLQTVKSSSLLNTVLKEAFIALGGTLQSVIP